MDISRRWFIGSLASFGALAGCRVFSSESKPGGTPRLTFGVVSDVHVQLARDGKTISKSHDTATLEHTFAWFRDQGADAVVIAGDIADKGLVEEMQAVADAWRRVFPDDRAPDGRKVERVFVMGNHDREGYKYGQYGEKIWPDAAELAKHVFSTDMKGNWERIWDEPFAPVYRKDVKGYTFVGGHWTGIGCRGADEAGVVGVEEFFAREAKRIDPSKPFFYVQHPHPKDTCYGAAAWGRDMGQATRALSAFPNAVAFSGHSHFTLTDERSIWQGAFTSLGTASLRYTGVYGTDAARADREGYQNRRAHKNFRDLYDPKKMMASVNTYENRQGMLVRVYDDRVVFARREFLTDMFLGPDWVLPLPNAEPRPYSIAARAEKAAAPAFPAGAAAALTRGTAKPRGGKGVPRKAAPAVTVTVPAATAEKGARPFEYEVTVETRAGATFVKWMLAPGYHCAPEHPDATGPVAFTLAESVLPKGEAFRMSVRAVSCFAKKSAALATDWMTI